MPSGNSPKAVALAGVIHSPQTCSTEQESSPQVLTSACHARCPLLRHRCRRTRTSSHDPLLRPCRAAPPCGPSRRKCDTGREVVVDFHSPSECLGSIRQGKNVHASKTVLVVWAFSLACPFPNFLALSCSFANPFACGVPDRLGIVPPILCRTPLPPNPPTRPSDLWRTGPWPPCRTGVCLQ